MPDHHPHTNRPSGRRPTPRQQRHLRELALARGITFVVPRTRAQASQMIEKLKRRAREPAADRRRELRAVQADLAAGRGDAARVRENLEVTGYGSSATWKRVRP